MAKKEETALTVSAPAEVLAVIGDSFPVERGFNKMFFPRLGFYSQDQVEGKGKAMKVTTEAGTFYLENQTDEVDPETGKRKWSKTEIGTEVEGIILYFRKQLKYYDGTSFTSSPIYDTEDEVIPLFKDKAQVDKGTPEELRKREIYQGKTAAGKPTSKLEENKVLYILIDGQTYQMNVRGGSMYAFGAYKRLVMPPTVVTKITSESKENGAIAWNQMLFTSVRTITAEEAKKVQDQIDNIRTNVMAEKLAFADHSNDIVQEDEATRIFNGIK